MSRDESGLSRAARPERQGRAANPGTMFVVIYLDSSCPSGHEARPTRERPRLLAGGQPGRRRRERRGPSREGPARGAAMGSPLSLFHNPVVSPHKQRVVVAIRISTERGSFEY